MFRFLGCALVAVVVQGASASDLYFSIDDDTKKDWSYAPGWKAT